MRKRHKTRVPGIFYRLADESQPDGPRRYIVWYSDAEGREHTKTLPAGATLEDAVLLKSQLQVRKSQGESLVRPRTTVSQLLEDYLEGVEGRLDETTVETHRRAVTSLKKAFGYRLVTELTPSHVARWISDLEREGKSAGTIRRYLSPLSSAYRLAVRDGVVQSSPVVKLLPHERPKGEAKRKRCLSREEITKLLAATRSQDGRGEHLRWKALFALLIFTGLRISEALALTWDDITEEGVVVREGKTAAAERTVMLPTDVRRLLSALRLSQAPGIQFVFSTQEGAPLGRRNALTILHSCCRRAGIEKCSLHELRHTYASLLIHNRELPTLVAKQMGHKDPSITMKVYAHLFEEQESIDQARDRLQAAMGGLL